MTLDNSYNDIVDEILTLSDMVVQHNTGKKLTNKQVIEKTLELEQYTKPFLLGVLCLVEAKLSELNKAVLNEILGESELMRLS